MNGLEYMNKICPTTSRGKDPNREDVADAFDDGYAMGYAQAEKDFCAIVDNETKHEPYEASWASITQEQDIHPLTDEERVKEIVGYLDGDRPKFKVGDWLTSNEGIWGGRPFVVIDNSEKRFVKAQMQDGSIFHPNIMHIRKWTIQDAKDGDVLSYMTDDEELWIMIYQSLYRPYKGHVHYHALLVNEDFGSEGTCCIDIDELKPATKEQRDLLFSKMHEAGYEWNAEKKELKLIEKVDGFDAELNALLKKYEHLPKGEVVECLSFYLEDIQGKPKWTDKDDKMFIDCCYVIHRSDYSSEIKLKIINWIKSLKKYLQEEKFL